MGTLFIFADSKKKHYMKKSIFQVFSFLFVLLTINIVVAQEVNIKEDSAKYIVPQSENADLKLIVPPSGFEVSTLFNGYIYLQGSSSIIMTLIEDVNYMKICEGMTDEFYKRNKLTYISDSKFTSVAGVKGRMYKFSFQIENDQYIRYMVYAGDLKRTLWLNITYPIKFEELIEGEMIKSINSINFKPTTDEKK